VRYRYWFAAAAACGACALFPSLSNLTGDAGVDSDSAVDVVVGDGGALVYNDFSNTTFWSTFPLTELPGTGTSYCGGAYDGRYVYFSPSTGNSPGGPVIRYDTTRSFTDTTSWSTFDAHLGVDAGVGMTSGRYDGRYVYFVRIGQGLAVRYDTQGTFTTDTAWTSFAMSSLPGAAAIDPSGPSYDGRYLYLAPTMDAGIALRYDPTSTDGFASSASWSVYSTNRTSAGGAFVGGREVFGPRDGTAQSYDTSQGVTSSSAWSTFDVGAIQANAMGFGATASDGRYVYFQPRTYSLALRYDSTLGFGEPTAWTTFDTSATATNYGGVTTDGRFAYLLPESTRDASTPGGLLTRYDSTGDFASAAAWSTFDTTTLTPNAAGRFCGAVFDGEYIYFTPESNAYATIARFQARTPYATPPLAH
jgi:hypothetical protein